MTQTRIPSAAPLATTHTHPIDPSLDRRTTQAEAALGCAGPQEGRIVTDVVVSRQLVVCGREVFCVACRRRRRQRGGTRSLTHAHTERERGKEGEDGYLAAPAAHPSRSLGLREASEEERAAKGSPLRDASAPSNRTKQKHRSSVRPPAPVSPSVAASAGGDQVSARLQGGSLPERDGSHADESVRSATGQ